MLVWQFSSNEYIKLQWLNSEFSHTGIVAKTTKNLLVISQPLLVYWELGKSAFFCIINRGSFIEINSKETELYFWIFTRGYLCTYLFYEYLWSTD